MSSQKTIAFKGTNEQKDLLLKVIELHKDVQGALIPVLHEAQEIYGYLPIEVQKIVSDGLNIPLTEIYGVVTFYTRFSLEPKGKNHISVCMGTACYVKGAAKIIDKVKEKLALQCGECTEDANFSLEATRCIGACGLAPVMTVNEDVYGRLTADDVEDILEKYIDA